MKEVRKGLEMQIACTSSSLLQASFIIFLLNFLVVSSHLFVLFSYFLTCTSLLFLHMSLFELRCSAKKREEENTKEDGE